MDASSLISLCSAFVAMLAALYARQQASAAKKATEISLHENRLKVYSGLSRFRVHVTGQGTNIKEEEVWRFAEVAELSDFYFSENIAAQMNSVFDRALKLLSLNDEWRAVRENDPSTARCLVQPRHELMRQMRDDCYKISDAMKGVMRVGNA